MTVFHKQCAIPLCLRRDCFDNGTYTLFVFSRNSTFGQWSYMPACIAIWFLKFEFDFAQSCASGCITHHINQMSDPKAANACPVCWTSVSLQELIDNHSIAVKTIIGIWATDFHHATHTCENIAKLLICKMLSQITRSYYRHVFHSPIFVRHIKTRNAFRCVIMVTDGFNNNPHGGLSHIVWRYVTIISDLRALGGMMSHG